MSETAEKSVLVCLRNQCAVCKLNAAGVPPNCPYPILHALENGEGGIQDRPRRSGKTTELVKLANEIAAAGYKVYFVTVNYDMANRTMHLGLMKGVVAMSMGQVRNRFGRGLAPGFILCDEIQPDDINAVRSEMVGSQLVAAYYTAM